MSERPPPIQVTTRCPAFHAAEGLCTPAPLPLSLRELGDKQGHWLHMLACLDVSDWSTCQESVLLRNVRTDFLGCDFCTLIQGSYHFPRPTCWVTFLTLKMWAFLGIDCQQPPEHLQARTALNCLFVQPHLANYLGWRMVKPGAHQERKTGKGFQFGHSLSLGRTDAALGPLGRSMAEGEGRHLYCGVHRGRVSRIRVCIVSVGLGFRATRTSVRAWSVSGRRLGVWTWAAGGRGLADL